MPDYEKWSKPELWTLIEAACLLAGIEPVDPNPRTFGKKLKTGEFWVTIYNDLKDAVDLGTIEFRKSRTGHVGNIRIQPAKCLAWANKRGYDVPRPLLDLVPPIKGVETAEQRGRRIEAAIAEEKKKGKRNFTATVAQNEGVSTGRIRQILSDAERRRTGLQKPKPDRAR